MTQNAYAQKNKQAPEDSLVVVSYNVENLFDTIDNQETNDDEFTPTGAKHWTRKRYYQKLHSLARVLSHLGTKQHLPDIVCLVEVENATVLRDLLHYSGLKRQGYKFVITHSPDPRGIDVAILYRQDRVELRDKAEYTVAFSKYPERKSRNVLEVCFGLPNGDKLYAMGVHWPSRREGAKESEPLRCDVARLMRTRCDSIYQRLGVEDRERTHFVLMGDFNEEADEEAIAQVLRSDYQIPLSDTPPSDKLELVSLMHRDIAIKANRPQPLGSYCYRDMWVQLDHFIISESLFKSASKTQFIHGSAYNYFAPFLGSKQTCSGYPAPWRTYGGNLYLGGYSDHYPIRLSLLLKQN